MPYYSTGDNKICNFLSDHSFIAVKYHILFLLKKKVNSFMSVQTAGRQINKIWGIM